ncbi:MAG: hypothetical protein ACT4RN_03035 [Pseudonocardia sp.]
MLKKASIAAAVAAAALLTAGSLAYADDDNGIGKGNNPPGTGNSATHCNESFAGNGMIFKDSAGTDCENNGESIGQSVEQFDRNGD